MFRAAFTTASMFYGVFAFVSAAALAVHPVTYKATPLGTLAPNEVTWAFDLNNHGEATGGSGAVLIPPGTDTFLWDAAGGIRSVEKGFEASAGLCISDSGYIGGYALDCLSLPDCGEYQFFLLRYSPQTGLETFDPIFDRAEAYNMDINDFGEIAGTWPASFFHNHAFRFTDESGVEDLGTLAENDRGDSAAFAINNSGQIVGWAWEDPDIFRAYRFDPGVGMIPIGFSTNDSGMALDINDAGQTVGYADGASFGRAFRHSDATGMQDLHALLPARAEFSEARFINEAGAVTGTWGTFDGERRAWYYSDETGMVDIGDLGIFGLSVGPTGLNERGEVVGVATRGIFAVNAPFIWSQEDGLRDIRGFIENPPGELLGDIHLVTINDRGEVLVETSFSNRAYVLSPNDYALDVTPITAGEIATLTISGAEPGATQYIAFSRFGKGSTPVPQLGVILDLDRAQLLASTFADDNGSATVRRRAPLASRGLELTFQAAQQGSTTNTAARVVE